MAARLFSKAFLIIAVLFIALAPAFAENDSVTYDCTDDFQAYARMVAQLNQERQSVQNQRSEDGTKGSPTLYFALLCQTDGRAFDFSKLSPACIVAGPWNCFTLFFSSEESCLDAVSILQETDGILYAEPDCEVHANGSAQEKTPDTPLHSFFSWGASQMNFSEYINFAEAWGDGSASIAVIDSGVFPHSLIQGKLLPSGFDYVDGDDDTSDDPYGHGTNVAGIIADCTAEEPVYIYPIRVLDETGNGFMSNVVNAVREAITRGVNIINLSLESSVMSQALDNAILDAVASGITVVVAAGNSSRNTSEVCPAHLMNAGVIVVGAAEGANGDYSIASYSNYGASVDVYAFGTGITCCSNSGGYSSETGTSMAAPHISALCAMMRLIHPGLSPEQTEQRLLLASAGTGTVAVPDAICMIPAETGFYLASIRMSVNDSLPLPATAIPLSASEAIFYQSENEQIAVFQDGALQAKETGTTTITVSCTGFEVTSFQVTVNDAPDAPLILPETVEHIEDEAFYGASSVKTIVIPNTVLSIGDHVFEECEALHWIQIPDSVTDIGENTFSGAIILCKKDSDIYSYALALKLQYITLSQDEPDAL